MISIKSYQWGSMWDHRLGNVYGEHIISSGSVRPSTCLYFQWWSEMEMKSCIIVGCHKVNHDTFIYIQLSFKLFKPISKIVSDIIFSNLYNVLVAVVIKENIRWVIRSPLLMIFWGYLNVVLQLKIQQYHNSNINYRNDKIITWGNTYSINMECSLKLIYDCASQEFRWGLNDKISPNKYYKLYPFHRIINEIKAKTQKCRKYSKHIHLQVPNSVNFGKV